MATEPSRGEANRLYWETDAPVGRIAETLGISRRALYELLERIPADGPCPECGGPTLFANRLARSTGEAQCGACGASTIVATVRARDPDTLLAQAAVEVAGSAPAEPAQAGEEGAYPAWNAPPEAAAPERRAPWLRDRRVLTIAAVAAAGLLIGACATLMMRRGGRR